MATSALKDDPQIYTVPPILIPSPAYWNNFADAWTRLDFTRAAINSVFLYAVPVTIFHAGLVDADRLWLLQDSLARS